MSKQLVDSEFLAPFSAGIFVKGVLRSTSDVVVNVGSGVAVRKSVPDAVKLLDSQLSEVREAQARVLLDLSGLTKQAMVLERNLRDLSNVG